MRGRYEGEGWGERARDGGLRDGELRDGGGEMEGEGRGNEGGRLERGETWE